MNLSDSKLMIFHMDMNHICLQVEYIKKWLKKLAAMGYNAILWEVEDKIQWETCPECVHPEAMSKAEFHEILAYTKDLGLEAIPLLQTFGHGEYVLLHDKYKSFREQPDKHDCYCTSNPEVKVFQKAWISEYLELFGNIRHFHLGGDEAYVFGTCPECKAAIEASSANTLYAKHLIEIADEIIAKGIRPGIWGDMLLHYPDEIDQVPSQFIIWDWNYWDGIESPKTVLITGQNKSLSELTEEEKKQTPELINEKGQLNPFYTTDVLLRLGREVILCSSSRCFGNDFFLPEYTTHIPNIIGAARKTVSNNLLGNCVTSWAIRINTFETQEPLFALAPLAMQKSDASLEQLIQTASGSAMDLVQEQDETVNCLLNELSAIQHSTLKDSLPAPEGYIKKKIKEYNCPENSKHKIWENRIDIVTRIQSQAQESLKFLQESGLKYAAPFAEAIKFRIRRVAAFLLLFNGKYACALQDFEQLKRDITIYLEKSQTPISAAHNSGLIFNPLIEYCQKEALSRENNIVPKHSQTSH